MIRVLVLVKEVPDMSRVRFDSEKGTVDRSSADAEINPFDMNALQAAVNLKKEMECEITVLTMGPPRAERTLRDAYARGADRVILLTDRGFGGADTLATSKTLAAAIRKKGSYDLILCGEKSVDGDTAQVGPEVAEFLGIPHSCYVEKISGVSEGWVEVVCDNICGYKQARRLNFPALLSVTKNINYTEMPSVKRKLASLKTAVEIVGLADLEGFLTADDTGFRGSPTKVAKIRVPKAETKEGKLFRDTQGGDFIGEFRRACGR